MGQLWVLALQQTPTPSNDAINQAVVEGVRRVSSGPFGFPGVLIPVSSTLGFFAVVALLAWLLFRYSQARAEVRTNFHRQLLEKFASGGEFATFLNSRGGQQLLGGLWSQRVDAKHQIIRSMRGGIVLSILGLGALLLSIRTPGLLVVGGLVLAAGIGFLVSAALSYRVSKTLGLLQEAGNSGSADLHA